MTRHQSRVMSRISLHFSGFPTNQDLSEVSKKLTLFPLTHIKDLSAGRSRRSLARVKSLRTCDTRSIEPAPHETGGSAHEQFTGKGHYY